VIGKDQVRASTDREITRDPDSLRLQMIEFLNEGRGIDHDTVSD
jgi:hypothetical protein